MSIEPTRAALQTALDSAVESLQALEQMAVAPSARSSALRNRLGKPLADEGISPQQVIAHLVADCDGAMVGSASGRFFGWAIGGTLPAAIAADWLVSAWDQNAALYSCRPAAAQVEDLVGSW